jgi:hypothetical protein
VNDAPHVRRALHAKGLAIYVDPLQANQIEAAKKLAAKIPGAEVVFNPEFKDYVLDWDLPAELESANEHVRVDRLLGIRRPIRGYFQWVGAMSPAIVWNRPAVVFGNASNNRLIADMNSATLLPRPAQQEYVGPGRAFIGAAASAFWNDQDVVYALCSDAAGACLALEKLASLEADKESVPPATTSDSPLAQRRQQLGFEPPRYPVKLVELKTETIDGPKTNLMPCVPVIAISATEDGGTLVTLGTPGRNFIKLDNQGREQARTITGGWSQPIGTRASPAGESISWDVGEATFEDANLSWRHDAAGKLRWKMIGVPATPVAADGSVWVAARGTLKNISAAGDVINSIDVKDKLLALAADGKTVYVSKAGPKEGSLKVDASVTALDVSSGKQLWAVEQVDAIESKLSEDGKILACVEKENFYHRDDMSFSTVARLTVIDTTNGHTLMRAPIGRSINNLLISPDDSTVMARLQGYSDVVYLADLKGGTIRQMKLPESGGWAHAFAPDDRALWVACDENLYRVDLQSLDAQKIIDRRVLQIVATPEGIRAGTADGHVLWIADQGNVIREVDLAAGLAIEDTATQLGRLRDAKLVDSPALRPHEFPDDVNLVYEFPRGWSDPFQMRGDDVQPLSFGVNAPAAGKYQFTMTLHNPPAELDKLGTFTLVSDDGASGITAPVNGDKLHQSAVLTLKPGAWLISIHPRDWKTGPLVREMKIEKVN